MELHHSCSPFIVAAVCSLRPSLTFSFFVHLLGGYVLGGSVLSLYAQRSENRTKKMGCVDRYEEFQNPSLGFRFLLPPAFNRVLDSFL